MSEMVGTPHMIKLLNKDVIEGIIKVNGPITKPEIAKLTNLSLVTVNKTVDILLKENKVKVSDVQDSSVGRRAQYFEINEELYYIIGLHYHCDTYVGAVSNSIGSIVYQKAYPVRSQGSCEEVMEDTLKALDSLSGYCKGREIAIIGLGVPGVVKEGMVTNIPSIPSLEGIDVCAELEKYYSTTVFLENDINLAAMGVYYSQFKNKVDNLVLVYLEQGIGSGLILNRELFKGSTNFAGELSYLPVTVSAGLSESCKYKGSFEHRIVCLEEELKQSSGSRKRELKSLLRNTIADGLMSVICIINPQVLCVACSQLSRADIKIIEEMLRERIGEENLPKFMRLEDVSAQSISGLINMCIREITPTYSLSSRKRG